MFGRILGVLFIGIGLYIGWLGVQIMLTGLFDAIQIVIVGGLFLGFGIALVAGAPLKDIIGDFFIRMR